MLVREPTLKEKIELEIEGGGLSELARKDEPQERLGWRNWEAAREIM